MRVGGTAIIGIRAGIQVAFMSVGGNAVIVIRAGILVAFIVRKGCRALW